MSEATLSDDELRQKLAISGKSAVRALAAGYTEPAVKKLAQLMRSKKTPPSVQRACARDLLEFGHGKPGQEINLGGGDGGTNIVVNVISLTDGTIKPLELEEAREPHEAVLDAEVVKGGDAEADN